jgi:hypothetical protein
MQDLWAWQWWPTVITALIMVLLAYWIWKVLR